MYVANGNNFLQLFRAKREDRKRLREREGMREGQTEMDGINDEEDREMKCYSRYFSI